VIAAIRYLSSSGSGAPQGAPSARALRVLYNLPEAEVRTRIERALRAGAEGLYASDLADLEAGRLREVVLERLFEPDALQGAFGGTVDANGLEPANGRLRRHVEFLEQVYRLSEAVSRADGVDIIYAEALDALQGLLGADRAAVLLFDPDGVIRFEAWRGLSEGYRSAVSGHSPWTLTEADPRPILVDDAAGEPTLEPFRAIILGEGIRALGFIPLVHGSRLLGKFMVYYDAPHRFTDEEVRAAQVIAHHIAFALARKRADDEAREINQRLVLAAVRERQLAEAAAATRTAAEAAHAEAQRTGQHLEAVFSCMVDGVLVSDATGRIVLANDGAARIFGVPREELLRPMVEYPARFGLRTADGAERPTPLGSRALSGEVLPAVERTIVDGTGLTRWLRTGAAPLRDERGNITGSVIVIADITERKRAEEERERLLAREQAARLEAEAAARRAAFLAEASRVLAASLEYETTLKSVARLAVPALADFCVFDVLASDGAIQRVAWAHAEVARQALADTIARYIPAPHDARHPVIRALSSGAPTFVPDVSDDWMVAAASSPEDREFMRELAFRSVMTVPLVARARILGALTFVIVAASGRRHAPADLALAEELARRAALAVDNARLFRDAQEAARQAVAASRARDTFLARASHELRTPLTAVLGTLRLLKRAMAGALDAQPEALVDIANRNLDTMLALINDLLDASKLGATDGGLVVEPVELAAVVRESLDVVSAEARERGLLLDSAVPDGVRVPADRVKLEQVFVNLLANAVKFTAAGGHVAVEAQIAGDAVVLRVRDTGEGIAPDQLERIFEPFYQAGGLGDSRATSRRAGRVRGTGLGLAICRQIVQLHGGTIHAESAGPGRGATFVVRLPAAAARSQAA
jgi:PAS domain S-box-containing protein